MEQLQATLEKILRFSAVLAAFGYMSLRAHLNHLGVPAPWPLPADRYLMEVYVLAIGTAPWLLILGSIVAAVALASRVLMGVLGASRAAQRLRDLAGASAERLRSASAAWLVLLAVAVGTLLLLGYASLDLAVVVGDLRPEALAARGPWPFAAALSLFVGGWVVSSLAARGSNSGSREPPSAGSHAWKLCRGGLLVLALVLPLLFGQAAHPVTYPVCRASLTGNGADEACVLLVLGDDTRLHFWRAQKGIGEVSVVLTSGVKQLECLGTKDILRTAAEAARTRDQQFPNCTR